MCGCVCAAYIPRNPIHSARPRNICVLPFCTSHKQHLFGVSVFPRVVRAHIYIRIDRIVYYTRIYYSKIAAIRDLGPPCSIHKNTTLNRQVRKRAGTARRRQRFDTNYSCEFKCLNYLLLFPVRLGCFILTTAGTIIIILIYVVVVVMYSIRHICENTFYRLYIYI